MSAIFCAAVRAHLQVEGRSFQPRIVILTFASLALSHGFGLAQLPNGTEQGKGTWVQLKYNDGSKGRTLAGFVEATVFEKLIAGDAKGFIKFEHVFLQNQGDGFGYQDLVTNDYGSQHFIYVRAALITELVPLKGEYIQKAYSKAERDKAIQRSNQQPRSAPGTLGIP